MDRIFSELREFENFRKTILPAIRQDLQKGMSAKELREKYAALIQARQITEAITSEDPRAALAAGKDVIDRAEGKAIEKTEITHKFDHLTDEEFEAVLKSEEEDLKDMKERFTQ